jgi:hypothetical protein
MVETDLSLSLGPEPSPWLSNPETGKTGNNPEYYLYQNKKRVLQNQLQGKPFKYIDLADQVWIFPKKKFPAVIKAEPEE